MSQDTNNQLMKESMSEYNDTGHHFRLRIWNGISVGLLCLDYNFTVLSYFLALYLKYDGELQLIPHDIIRNLLRFMPIYGVVTVGIYWICGLYKSIWRFASYTDLRHCIVATLVTIPMHAALMRVMFGKMPLAYYFFGGILQFMFLTISRFSCRFMYLTRNRYENQRHNHVNVRERIMLIGAGTAGQLILRDVTMSRFLTSLKICCIIDDDRDKWGRYIDDIPVVGGRNDIAYAVNKYRISKIFLALPSANAKDKQTILNICKETGCKLQTLPGLYQLTSGEVTVNKLREIDVDDLLGRDPIIVDNKEIFSSINGHTVLVTGGGGSIGSELCRQIAAHSPALLIILDIYENNAYNIQQDLRAQYGNELNLKVLIGSVRDSKRIDSIFRTYKPDYVFHAAAHKHVPLMEDSPCEAIKNNVIGTYKTAYAAMINGCKRFVLISTDKAVNPTNIMGASKRLCEMVIQSMAKIIELGDYSLLPHIQTHADQNGQFFNLESDVPKNCKYSTEFVAVRFGNVLNSNGSVIPLFKQQIKNGGPVTVTHPDITRFFMTIPEAVSLVLQAATYAKGGEIFVLDMGEPVKIDTLARSLIKLSGLRPDIDIEVKYTGLRPGEKLYEEKLMSEEGLKKTDNNLIYIARPLNMDLNNFLKDIGRLITTSSQNSDEIFELVKKIVPTYSGPIHK